MASALLKMPSACVQTLDFELTSFLNISRCVLVEHIVHYCFNQMSAKDGIAKHGEEAIVALFKEFSQLHNKKVFKAIKASELTRQQKKNSLHALNLIKEKRNGVIKGRDCG